MSRLGRLRAIRAIELNRGLRVVAATGQRLGQLQAMQLRLAALAEAIPAGASVAASQAAAASRQRLRDAAVQVAAAGGEAQAARAAATEQAARLQVRVDVVDKALARQ